ncbi:MAG TPA: LptA/OstA family protein, partial [Steroidobacteraceae bacterium]|nr:LptA/OstA family protein [Steroidobacteraceae bacterium]
MPRSSPFWIVFVSLGGILPAARAEDPPCPTQLGLPAAAAAANGAPAAAAPAGVPRKPAADDGRIDVASDQAILGVDGNAILKGNVVLRQGEREIRANEVEYDAHDTSVRTAGHIDYTDSLVHVTGVGGSYSAAAGAEFKSAQFALRQRAARGSAQDMTLTPQGVIRLRGVMFTTCPANDTSWQLQADNIMLDTRNRVGTGSNAQ